MTKVCIAPQFYFVFVRRPRQFANRYLAGDAGSSLPAALRDFVLVGLAYLAVAVLLARSSLPAATKFTLDHTLLWFAELCFGWISTGLILRLLLQRRLSFDASVLVAVVMGNLVLAFATLQLGFLFFVRNVQTGVVVVGAQTAILVGTLLVAFVSLPHVIGTAARLGYLGGLIALAIAGAAASALYAVMDYAFGF
jgi:hypothetical protein